MKRIAMLMTLALAAVAFAAESKRDKYKVGMTVEAVKEVMATSPAPHTTMSAKMPPGASPLISPHAFYVDVPGDGVRLFFGQDRKLLRIDDFGQNPAGQRTENASSAQGLPAGVHIKTDNENVVASRLIGKWKIDAILSERLQGTAGRDETLAFVEDKTVASKLPERYVQAFMQKPLFLAGTMTRNGKEYPFILTEHHGNPYVFYFREKNGDPMGDGESFNLVIAPAKDRMKDMLFIGGDFNNQPFVAFGRQKQE